MKKNLLFLIIILFTVRAYAQDFGFWASAVSFNINSKLTYYDTYDTTDANRIGNLVLSDDAPSYTYINFSGSLGTFVQNSGSLFINGGMIKTFKNSNSNVCGTILYYTIYPQGNRPVSPVFLPINFNFLSNCLGNSFTYDGSACTNGDQEWGDTTSTGGTDLTTYAPGNYTMEIYFQIPGAFNSTSDCSDIVYDNNNDANYIADFTIISNPVPVTLLNFSGIYHQPAVTVNWSVANTLNEKGFELARSTNEHDFTNLYFITAKESNTSTVSYSYTDNNPPDSGEVFYRLKLVDDAGNFNYSSILPINIGTGINNEFTAQLTANNLTVYFGSAMGDNSIIRLIDLQGNTIITKSLNVQPTSSIVSLPVSQQILPGVYVVSIFNSTSGNVVTKKIETIY